MATYLFAGKTWTLQSSISSTATSIILTSFKEPVSGANMTMALMNSTIAYGTLRPKTGYSELISFTGITQNSDGTATLTGVTRGLKRGYDYTASATFQLPHPGGSKFILSDSPQALNAVVGSTGLTVGSTTIASGTNTKVLYNNSGTVGEYTISGTGNVAMTTSPTFTTPNISSIINTGTLTLPTSSDTLVGRATNDTLTNKTLTTPVINGTITGTGQATAATASTITMRDANANLYANNIVNGYTTTATAAGTTTLTVSSTQTQFFTGSTTQTVLLPVTSTLTLGHTYRIVNNSTGNVTVQSSGANTISILGAAASAIYTCILTSGTSAASWSASSVVAAGSPTQIQFNTGGALAATDQLTFFSDTTNNIVRIGTGTSGTGSTDGRLELYQYNGSTSKTQVFPSSTAGTVSITMPDATTTLLGNTTALTTTSSSGVGYRTGAGGTVTQATSRNTGVTLNKITGAITLVSALNAAVSGATANTFTVTNSTVAATDTIIVSQKSGTDKYLVFVTAVAAGSFALTFYTTGGTSTEQPVFNFAVIKAVTA